MVEKVYIVASCKSWHKPSFIDFSKKSSGKWIWVETPQELLDVLKSVTPRYIFFLHWNWYVPNEIWDKYECVCFHMTDVPYGRGGSPLQNLILEGHAVTKLTALKMVKEMDAGPVYIKRDLPLDGAAQDIYMRAGTMSFEIIQWLIENEPNPVPQTGEPHFFKRRKPEQSCLPEKGSPKEIYDFVRMLDAESYPRSYIEYGNMRIEFKDAKIHGNVVSTSASITFKEGEEGDNGC